MLRIAAVLALTMPAHAVAEPLFVPAQYPTIQAAIDAAQPGDEIHIAPGIYRELLDPENKSLTLIGAGPDQTILTGDIDGDTVADGVILHYQNELADVLPFITLDGLAFESSTAGIRAYRAAQLSVNNSAFSKCDYGIDFSYNQSGELLVFDVVVHDSTFTGPGGGARITRSLTFEMRGCHFDSMTGVQLDIYTDYIDLHQSSFMNATNDGVHIRTSSGTIQDCVFDNNAGAPGTSALSLIPLGSIEIIRTNFLNNGNFSSGATLGIGGGGVPVLVSDCIFDGNRGYNESAVFAFGTLHFDGCTFRRNVGRGVGPINLLSSSTQPSIISDCIFEDNGDIQPDNTYWPGGGGGLCLEEGTLIVRNSIFKNNIATIAGAIMMGGRSSHCVVESSEFLGNRAGGSSWSSAGAIYAGSTSRLPHDLTIANSIFIGNSAENHTGGAIEASTRTATSNCVYIGNQAKEGSIIYIAKDVLGKALTPRLSSSPTLSSCIVVSSDSGSPFQSSSGPYSESNVSNLITNQIQSVGFTRIPNHGGDGFGDDPRTPDIDESLNDDYGDLRLLPGSPAIDAGGNTKLPRDVYDLDRDGDRDEFLVGLIDLAGNPRFVDDPSATNHFDAGGLPGPIDLGPYEYQPVSRTMTVRTKHINPDR